MQEIKIIGQSITKFGELWDRSLESLLEEAVWKALVSVDGCVFKKQERQSKYGSDTQHPKYDPKKIEAVFVANMAGEQFSNQAHLGALVSQMFPHNPPAIRVEAACASGGVALVAAQQALLSGLYKTVLVVGAEKMTDISSQKTTQILSAASEYQEEYGSTFPALYALLAKSHMQKYGTTREQLSAVSSKNHEHAITNHHAQFRKKISKEVVSNSTLVSDPLRLLDCSPVSDGASAVILSTKNIKRYQDKPVIVGFGQAQDSLSLAERKSLTQLQATREAARIAFSRAGVSQKNISYAEVHDCFTIAELLAVEDIGFFKKGSAGQATLEGQTTYGGQVVVNPSGGLKACGHPVGATGVKQVAYLSELLSNKKGKKPIYALSHNVGGSGATAVVHILKSPVQREKKG